jgi:hypothetical protein
MRRGPGPSDAESRASDEAVARARPGSKLLVVAQRRARGGPAAPAHRAGDQANISRGRWIEVGVGWGVGWRGRGRGVRMLREVCSPGRGMRGIADAGARQARLPSRRSLLPQACAQTAAQCRQHHHLASFPFVRRQVHCVVESVCSRLSGPWVSLGVDLDDPGTEACPQCNGLLSQPMSEIELCTAPVPRGCGVQRELMNVR